MKINQFIQASVFGLALFAFAGCDDAKNDVIENRIYISEAAPSDKFTQQTVNLTVTGKMKTTLHVRLAQPVEQEIKVLLSLAPEAVEKYNRTNGTSYLALPETYLTFNKEVTIPANTLSSDAVEIEIDEFPTDDGNAYCVPICIASTDAPVATAQSAGHLIYLLTTPLMQTVPTMNSSVKPAGAGGWGIATSEWTLEGWIWMSKLTMNNQAFFSAGVSKGTEIYIRFGDANVPNNKIQIKTGGSQFNTNQSFSPQTWYHVAFVYGDGKCRIYVNGEEDNSYDISTDYVIENLSLCSSGSYFVADAKMAQIRFWKKALSGNAIKDAMNRAVAPDSDGLFGYWKLDEGSGDVYYDATSNHYDLTCSSSPRWLGEIIDFTNPNK